MQGFNMGRYYPPDVEKPPTFNTSHPLGSRARKIGQGILTVRFEMPFPIWCDTCNPPAIIGQGVRFNAEKKKVGNYYSTPIWSFRMKHTACEGWIEITTDPKATGYVVTEGGRRRDYGEEKGVVDELGSILTEDERERRRNDAFAALEGKANEKGTENKNRERVEELLEAQERDWKDPYEMNRRLRKDFRQQRKVLQEAERHKANIQDRFGLQLEITDENDSDKLRASLVEFGTIGSDNFQVDDASRKPLFAATTASHKLHDREPKKRKLKAEMKAEKQRGELQHNLIGNTRAAVDPFLADNPRSNFKSGNGIIPRLKRKRDNDVKQEKSEGIVNGINLNGDDGGLLANDTKPLMLLLDYDSD